jgi:poly-gamma-glutamate synthesis protein (capsule biosynthesis protein)
MTEETQQDDRRADRSDSLALLLCGDVMTGRGIDQALPHSVHPQLHEPWVKSALDYVALAEKKNGPISRPVGFSYIWGDALEVLKRFAPEARIINLETAVTTSGEAWPDKGIHYRMHPKNVSCLTEAGFQCCVLANNHVLDWGRPGLAETLASLHDADLQTAGAGRDLEEAAAPAVLPASGKGRVLVLGLGHESSGIPRAWAADEKRAGVNLLDGFSEQSIGRIAERVRAVKQPGDVVVASIHWGGNWGYRVPEEQRKFAHRLVERAGVDVVHGHSSHHPKGIEVHEDRPILYGCGDFINDYEGIQGYEEFRDDLSLMYFPRLDRASGRLLALEMVPMQIRRFRLHRAGAKDARWLAKTLDRESARFGCGVELSKEDTLTLRWKS